MTPTHVPRRPTYACPPSRVRGIHRRPTRKWATERSGCATVAAVRRPPGAWRLAAAAVAALAAAGCDLPGFGAPEPKAEQGESIFSLWQGFFLTAMAVGALVWGLLIFVILRYRRRDDDDPRPEPLQRAPRDPLHGGAGPDRGRAVRLQRGRRGRRSPSVDPDPVARIEVIGFQWSWQFVYTDEDVTITGEPGEGPELVVPVGEPVVLRLVSADVNHSFWVPDFLSKRDLIPGVDNEITITPTETGSYVGPMRRVLRPRPLAHELLGAGRVGRRVRGVARRAAATPTRVSRSTRRRTPPGRAAAVTARDRATQEDRPREAVTTLEERPVTRRAPRARGARAGPRPARLPDDDRSQAHRHLVHGDGVRLLPDRRRAGDGDPGRARRARLAGGVAGSVQRDVHHAREHHVVPVPGAVRLRPGELLRAAAGRRPRHGVPPAQRPVVLVLPVRRRHDADRVPHRRRRRRLRLDRLHAAVVGRALARTSAATCG